jgi:hypothetical protein
MAKPKGIKHYPGRDWTLTVVENTQSGKWEVSLVGSFGAFDPDNVKKFKKSMNKYLAKLKIREDGEKHVCAIDDYGVNLVNHGEDGWKLQITSKSVVSAFMDKYAEDLAEAESPIKVMLQDSDLRRYPLTFTERAMKSPERQLAQSLAAFFEMAGVPPVKEKILEQLKYSKDISRIYESASRQKSGQGSLFL